MANIKVMSFNMRTSTANDGINAFSCRKDKIRAMLSTEAPDIIGFQEITPEMHDFLVDILDDYYTVGAGRGSVYDGESSLIAFKKRDFQLISCDTVMLSYTPKVPGSVYEGSDQSTCPREFVKAFLKHREADEPFYFYNVHTDHKGALSRCYAMVQMLQDICSHAHKIIFTGDFNALPEAPEIRLITDCASKKIIDATASLDGTFHNYGRKEVNSKIDYVFVSEGMAYSNAAIVNDDPENGVYYSDHFAVTVSVEL